MAARHPNYRLVKIYRSYVVEEAATLLGVHRNTVREWIKRGLPTSDQKRPLLILGRDLTAFLQARRVKNKRTYQSGEIYCVRCRVPRNPAGDMAEYQPVTAAMGDLVGICPSCECMMYRRVNLAKLELVRGKLGVTMPQGLRHIQLRQCLKIISSLVPHTWATHPGSSPADKASVMKVSRMLYWSRSLKSGTRSSRAAPGALPRLVASSAHIREPCGTCVLLRAAADRRANRGASGSFRDLARPRHRGSPPCNRAF